MNFLETINTDLKNIIEYNDLIKKKVNHIMELPNSPEKVSALHLSLEICESLESISKLYLNSIEKYNIFLGAYTDNQNKINDTLN